MRRNAFLAGAAAAAALAVIVLLATLRSSAAPNGAWQAADCGRFGIKVTDPKLVECGYVTSPRRHADPKGPTIRLAVAVIHSSDANRKADPLFLAQGGPGGSTIDSFAEMLLEQPDTRPARDRDLVLWDQRGTLYSRPELLCPEVTKATLDSARNPVRQPEEVADRATQLSYYACGARLAREVGDLAAFNTVENADDVDTLATALGYGKINYYGVSYGTELGQYVLRRHSSRIRSMVLDAVVPTGFSLITGVPAVKKRIAQKYFDACKSDPHCNAAFPDLRERYLQMIAKLDAKPASLTVAGTGNQPSFATTMDGGDFSDALYQGLYIREVRPLIPYVVERATRGDYTLVSGFLLPAALEGGDKDATGMYMTVVCAERSAANLNALATDGLSPTGLKQARRDANDILDICRNWNIPELPSSVNAPVSSDVPTLLLSGDFDPITPPAFAHQVGEHLAHHIEVTFPSGTHGQAFDDPCANGIIAAFVDDPSATPQTSCAANEPSKFVTPRDLIIIPQLRTLVGTGGEKGFLAWVAGVAFLLPALFFLLTAVPVYAVVETVALLAGRRRAPDLTTAGGRYTAAAPWVAILAFVFFSATLLVLSTVLGVSFVNNALLTFLGAVPSSLRWVFFLPLAGILMVYLMARATIALWRGHSRSLVGRLYYSLLLLAALGVVIGFWHMGLITAILG